MAGVVCDDNRDAYHVDHIYPIMLGFKNNINPEIIAHISNLQCISGLDNITKGNNITANALNELNERYLNYERI